MSSESPLPQAYKKASEAELHAEARPPRLAEAVSAHEEAAILFARAEEQTEDDGAKSTLRAMKQQHSKAALELTRKLTFLAPSPSLAGPSSSRSATAPPPSPTRSRHTKPSNLSPATPPPFALPTSPTSLLASSTTRANPLAKQASERARLQRQMEFSSAGSGTISHEVADSPSSVSPNNPSSLYASSSSSSERTIDGSFMMLRHEKSDPFQRFWDVVEGKFPRVSRMLQDHSSNPVAFASAPLGSVIDPRSGRSGSSPSSHRKPRSSPSSSSSHKPSSSSAAKTAKHPSLTRRPSNLGMISSSSFSANGGQDSFYIVPPSRQASASSNSSSADSSTSPTTTSNPKTLEELTLENSSLRSSLDTLALHAQELGRKLAASQTSPEPIVLPSSTPEASNTRPLPPPPPPGGSVMLGGSVVDLKRLKKEAEKVWREEERARRAAQGASWSSATGAPNPFTPADQQRITSLESEVAHLKAQNEKQRDTIQRYKVQFEKIKSGARQRREAKAGAAAGTAGEGGVGGGGGEPSAKC